jgi:hypothetical protein
MNAGVPTTVPETEMELAPLVLRARPKSRT